jgi:hypothetical protein
MKERDHWEDPGIVGNLLKWMLKKWDECLDWIDVFRDRDTWRAFVNALMNLQ